MLTKILGAVALISLLTLGILASKHYESLSVVTQLNEQLQEAGLEVGRAGVRLTDFDEMKDYVSELEEVVRQDIEARNAQLTQIGRLRAELEVVSTQKGKTRIKYVETVIGAGQDISCPTATFESGRLYQAHTSKTLLPVSELATEAKDDNIHVKCKFTSYPNRTRDVRSELWYKLTIAIEAELIETKLPSGAINHYVRIWQVNDEGRRLRPWVLRDFNVVSVDTTRPHFQLWVPRLDISGTVTGGKEGLGLGASLGLSIMGYGRTEKDLSWRFLRPSVDTNGVGLTPAMYNMGEFIPLITNLWIGPHFVMGDGFRGGLTLGGTL